MSDSKAQRRTRLKTSETTLVEETTDLANDERKTQDRQDPARQDPIMARRDKARQERVAARQAERQRERQQGRGTAPGGRGLATELDKNLVADAAKARLKVFLDAEVERIGKTVGTIHAAPWPRIEGCLVVLFTARSGSTFLARELEYAYDIGRMGETLNPAQVRGQAVAKIVAKRQGAWFACKAGLEGVVAGEFYGFFEAYLEKTWFLRLVRRDIVAQAVSLAKAAQTQQWHVTDRPRRAAAYDAARIVKALKTIATGDQQLTRYAKRTGRPCRTLTYEDISGGDLSPILAAGHLLGLPRRKGDAGVAHRSVERMGDAINDEWRARFAEEMDASTRDLIDQYLDTIQP